MPRHRKIAALLAAIRRLVGCGLRGSATLPINLSNHKPMPYPRRQLLAAAPPVCGAVLCKHLSQPRDAIVLHPGEHGPRLLA
jgi:hypothetical protein